MMSDNVAASFTLATLSTMYVILAACMVTLEMIANAYTGSLPEFGLKE